MRTTLKQQALVASILAMCLSLYIAYTTYPRTYFDSVTSTIHTGGGAILEMDVSFGNIPTQVILDTGASYTSLTQNLVTTLVARGFAMRVGSKEIQLANGQRGVVPTYLLSRLVVGDCVVANELIVELGPNETNLLDPDGLNLLGLSTLKKLDAHFSVNDGSIRFRNCTKVESIKG